MKITVFIDSPIDYDQPLKGKAAFLRRDVTGFFINHPEWVTALWGQERAKQIERIQRNGSSNLQPVRGGLVVRRVAQETGWHGPQAPVRPEWERRGGSVL